MNTNRTSLAGEFYAMHRLFLEGYEATLTLGNTKSIDILLLNPKNRKQFKVEVKTGRNIMNSKLFGGKHYNWRMLKKHEDIKDPDLIYCFVFLPKDKKQKPKTFFVPSNDVAEYVKWQHQHWLKNKQGKNTDIRCYRIMLDKSNEYEDNFSLFE